MAREYGIRLIMFNPLGGGVLTGRYERVEDLAAATKKSARTINKALDKGHVVLLGFSRPGEGQEQYLYEIEQTCRDPGAKSLADEYIAFRKQYGVKEETQVD